MEEAASTTLIPPSHIIATIRLDGSPFERPRPPRTGDVLLANVATKARMLSLLKKGWVQFTWTKVTNGSESSVIATLNKHLYTYTFKGTKPPVKAGLMRFVALSRASAKGKPAWRSAYARTILGIFAENKNQGNGRPTKNTRVDVNTGSRQTIEWNYAIGRPL
jgi:hypothetical protein